MSRKELISVMSRWFGLLLATWAFVELTYLPERLFSLSRHLGEQSALHGAPDYWSSYYTLATVLLIIRVSALFIAAVTFWRCGPRVQALFDRAEGKQP
jgi:hypothetical protein